MDFEFRLFSVTIQIMDHTFRDLLLAGLILFILLILPGLIPIWQLGYSMAAAVVLGLVALWAGRNGR